MADLNGNAPSPWVPESDPRHLKALGKLAEEAGELASIVARCIIQGIDEVEPVTKKPNRVALSEEIADVLANAEVVIAHFGLDRDDIGRRKGVKKTYIQRWLAMLPASSSGVGAEIIAERVRQCAGEGWRTVDDDKHACGEMALAAAAYATIASARQDASISTGNLALSLWPWAWSWWKPKDPRRDLVRAGALIVAEIERLDRKAARS